MSGASQLSARTGQVLFSVVKAYIDKGEPVASQDARLKRFQLSPASLRSILAELDALGFLHQPHASAGRIPTRKAFQAFVGSLPGHRLQAARVGQIQSALTETSAEKRAAKCSDLLTEMTESVGIAAAIPAASQTLEQVELVPLGDRRVLMVVMTADKLVRDQVVVLDEAIPAAELTSIRNYINIEFKGWTVSGVRDELRRRLKETSDAYGLILKKLILLYQKGFLAVGFEPEVHLGGASNLMADELQVNRERLKELFRTLEEKQRILSLLDQFLDNKGEIGVEIGLGDHPPALGELALIGISVPFQTGLSVKVAVIGPWRMDYERAISAVLHVGRAYASLPS
jgi:heat-inducible transcriptional repressor